MIDWVIDWVWYLIYAYITVRLSKAAWILIKSVHIHLFAKEVDVSDILDSWAGSPFTSYESEDGNG